MIYLKERDKQLLQILSRFGVLSSNQIAKYFFDFAAQTTVLRRLKLLERDGMILNCGHLITGEKVWSLAKLGAKSIGISDPFRFSNQNTMLHDVSLSECRFALEKIGFGTDWTSEHEMKRNLSYSNSTSIVPDGLFTANVHGLPQVVAFELELHAKSHMRYRKIILEYAFMNAIGVIWYVVKDESIIKPIVKQLHELINQKRLIGRQKFLFTIFSDLISNFDNAKVVDLEMNQKILKEVFVSNHTCQGLSNLDDPHLSNLRDQLLKPNQEVTSASDFNLVVPSTLDPSTSSMSTVKGSRLTGTDKNTGAEVKKGKEGEKDEIDWWG